MFSRLSARSLQYIHLSDKSFKKWEVYCYIIIFVAAAVLRLWDLGSVTLHHDESIHAFWSWQLAFEGHYIHDPIFHGPFYYFVQAFTFLVFQDSDYTARLSVAFFGILLTALPLLLRRHLGAVGTIAAMAFIAFSPSLVYYSRFFRGDIYIAVFTLCMVIAIWRYLVTGRHRWLLVFAGSIVGIFLTKEMAYLEAAIFLLLLNALLSGDLAKMTFSMNRKKQVLCVIVLMPVAWLCAALWPLIGKIRTRLEWKDLPRSGDLLILLGTLILPLLIAFLRDPLEMGIPLLRDFSIFQSIPFIGKGVVDSGILAQDVVCVGSVSDRMPIIVSLLIVGGLSAAVGLLWKPKIWLICALLGSVIFATFMTTFWTNVDGLCTGLWGSLDYWRDQQVVRRGEQPWFYYLMIVPPYEFLLFSLALPGLIWSFFRRDYFAKFLSFWLIAVFFALSFAGEKMPWLTVHIALPAALLAAWSVYNFWGYWFNSGKKENWLKVAFAIFAVSIISAVAFPVAVYVQDLFLGVRVLLVIFPLLLFGICIHQFGSRSVPFVAAILLISALSFFSLRTMTGLAFVRGDVPKDLLIYTQSSPYLKELDKRIDRIVDESQNAHEIFIAVDSKASFAWPWVWYFRDFPGRIHYGDHVDGLDFEKYDYSVILTTASNASYIRSELSRLEIKDNYFPSESYPHRWWFPETYKEPFRRNTNAHANTSRYYSFREIQTWEVIGSNVFRTSGRNNWFLVAYFFWRDHEPSTDLGSVDGVAWFAKNADP